MRIVIFGAGYVGLSMAVLLAKQNDLTLIDTNEEKVSLIKKCISPIKDDLIGKYLRNNMNVSTSICEKNIKSAEIIILALPTDGHKNKNLDTSILDSIFKKIVPLNRSALYVIKSTIPFGYTQSTQKKYNISNLIFSPEFSREGHSVYDNLYPERVVIGCDKAEKTAVKEYINAILSISKSPKILMVKTKEAELIKLVSNTYLAMRVAFFNEIDSFALQNNLNSKKIIKGVCLDGRIGDFYNNPSFGYGGYCLPKDTLQLEKIMSGSPLIGSITKSNSRRKAIITSYINEKDVKTVGIYKLNMKKGSDNMRNSAILDIISGLNNSNIIIYDPTIKSDRFKEFSVVKNLDEFKKKSDIVVANRMDKELADIANKVFTRDLFSEN